MLIGLVCADTSDDGVVHKYVQMI